jgi:hypothetical protein
MVAARARINRAGALRTLRSLAGSGLVQPVGQGRYVSYQPTASHPFAEPLSVLFEREAERAGGVREELAAAAGKVGSELLALWSLPEDEPGTLDLLLVATPQARGPEMESLRQAVERIGDRWSVSPRLRRISPAELAERLRRGEPEAARIETQAEPLWGVTFRQVVRSAPSRS